MDRKVVVAADALQAFASALFRRAGLPKHWADTEAEILVWADLRGTGSHGVLRIPTYLHWIGRGLRRPDAHMRIVTDHGPIAVLDADRGPGLVAMCQAVDEAMKRARDHGIGWLAVREVTHTGAMGYYVRRAAEAGFIGMTTCSSRPLMAYHGTKAPALGTAPIAIAVPRAGTAPVVLDMATAAIGIGRLAEARQRGDSLPEGVALDRTGRATTDPDAAALPLPIAGAKGAGLALMIECLTSLLVGRPLLASALDNQEEASDFVQNALAVVIDPVDFPGGVGLAPEVDRLTHEIADLPMADGIDEILMPGERGDRLAAERARTGIPIAAAVWAQLAEAANSLGVAQPETRFQTT